MNILLDLFITFAKIGLFTFGGGYAMISMIENNCVENRKWITHDEMMNITVIAESTPGPIAINCATYIGYKMYGFFGAIVATLGIIVPSFVVILAVSLFMDRFLEIGVIADAFKGIKIAVGILIFDAGLTMVKKMHNKRLPRMIMIISCFIMLIVNLFSISFSSITLMIFAGMISLCVFVVNGGNKS